MGIDDLKSKATDALDSDKGEKASDTGFDKARDAASSATGGSHDEQITKVQTSADERVGDE
ncbi:Rv0909 family putative TA system antitoxin [uncultured Cellulomonas sp.]|uniref:Rv0909 family putative TA system antitoxin n=1 Tax=uncultured Cellulomonas sp. TaxID=189682 RepID=UPI0028E3F413|nr:Rv0909 family putative TA system antitoxin [uncultured Cellulomonas sp.]